MTSALRSAVIAVRSGGWRAGGGWGCGGAARDAATWFLRDPCLPKQVRTRRAALELLDFRLRDVASWLI